MNQEIIKNWHFWTFAIACFGIVFSCFNYIVSKVVTLKIKGNDLVHLKADIDEVKENEKDFRKELKGELHNIFLAIRRIEKKQTVRDSICSERHKKDR